MQSKFLTCCAMLFISSVSFSAMPRVQGISGAIIAVSDWMKSPTGTWEGKVNGKAHWYKLDKNGALWHGADGKKWMASKEGTWADKSGRWLRIHEGKLVWSADGKEWAEVPEWKWEGSDGKWYRFDKDWSLWVN